MIYDMKLEHLLHGVTFECPSEALVDKPKVVRCVMEGKVMTSVEIDQLFSASKRDGESLYYVDEPILQKIAPDIIFTQDTCEVCQIDTACTASAVAKLPKLPQLISLSPNNLQDVFDCALTIARALGQEEAAFRYLSPLQDTLDSIVDTLRVHKAPLKRVLLMEWIEPIYNCGHWIPHQIAYAGGVDMLSNPSGDSIVTPWDKVVKYDPEVLVIAPCGFHIQRAQEELFLLQQKPGWKNLKAVQLGQVYLADFDLFTQPSASTLVSGVELLAALFHPTIFEVPERLQQKYQPFRDAELVVS